MAAVVSGTMAGHATSWHSVVRRRQAGYFATFALLFAAFFLLRGSTWQGNTELHTLMETVATLLAVNVGILTIIRFYSQKDNTFLFIGSGFLGTGLLDGYHTFVTSTHFSSLFPSPPPSLIPWSWLASRLFLSLALCLSWWFWRREERLGKAGIVDEKAVYAIVGALTLGCFLLFTLMPLPTGYEPGVTFPRPQEFVPAVVFAITLVGYLHKGRWRHDPFEHWLVLALIVSFMSQATFMSISGRLYDGMFDVAHLLKKVSYICVLVGLLINMYYLFILSAKESAMIREERDFSDALIENVPGFVFLIEESGRFARWNENLSALIGLSGEQLRGLEASSIIIESDRETARTALIGAFGRDRTDIEFGLCGKTGDVRTIRWSGRPITHHGHPYILCAGIDVTEMRSAENQLRASEERFRAVSETAQDAILTMDSARRITFWNRAATRIFGFSAEEVIGKKVVEVLIPPQFQEKAAKGLGDIATSRRTEEVGRTIEVMAAHKDGASISVELSLAPMRVGAEWHAVSILRDITQRKLTEVEMIRRARHDLLTGLANRGVFVEELERTIALADRVGKSFAVLYLDLDHFKDVNDTLGHPVGDLLLQVVAQRLESCVRETDLVARFGGDEFALLGAEIGGPANAAVLGEKVLKALSEPYSIQGNEIHSGASVGIAVYGLDSPDVETLLSHADVALYRAKSEGRGTYRFFTDVMDKEVRARVTLAAELRFALTAGQLFLVYQPQVNVDTDRIIGVEALVRWRHPTRGIVSPGEFIPVAEQSGLVMALGHWVLHEACRQLKEWLDAGIALPLIGVNVSGLQFKMPGELEDDIAGTLAEVDLSPEHLELELTETIFMEASREHNDVLLRLRKAGLRLAIDDFGTGYSSLEYLGRFPVDRVKIAQNFMVDLVSGSGNATIVKAAIGMARDLGLDVVIEGVETAEQLALIRSFGGHQVQGVYFSKPLLAGEATALLRTGKIVPPRPVVVEAAADPPLRHR